MAAHLVLVTLGIAAQQLAHARVIAIGVLHIKIACSQFKFSAEK
jgi:hypothetical protein